MSRGLTLGRGAINIPPLIDSYFATRLWAGTGVANLLVPTPFSAAADTVAILRKRGGALATVFNTVRGGDKHLKLNTAVEVTASPSPVGFGVLGLTLSSAALVNESAQNFIAWIFKRRTKLFDFQIYDGVGETMQVPHELGQTPGMVCTRAVEPGWTSSWFAWHRSLTPGTFLAWDNSAAEISFNAERAFGNNVTTVAPNSTHVRTGDSTTADGILHEMLLFGHDTAADGLIQCGSYTGNGNADGPTVTLGWEPQWLMIKNVNAGVFSSPNWVVMDSARGMSGVADSRLTMNGNGAESVADSVQALSTGFKIMTADFPLNKSGEKHIYVAIRKF